MVASIWQLYALLLERALNLEVSDEKREERSIREEQANR